MEGKRRNGPGLHVCSVARIGLPDEPEGEVGGAVASAGFRMPHRKKKKGGKKGCGAVSIISLRFEDNGTEKTVEKKGRKGRVESPFLIAPQDSPQGMPEDYEKGRLGEAGPAPRKKGKKKKRRA